MERSNSIIRVRGAGLLRAATHSSRLASNSGPAVRVPQVVEHAGDPLAVLRQGGDARRPCSLRRRPRCASASATRSSFVGKWWTCAPHETPARPATRDVVVFTEPCSTRQTLAEELGLHVDYDPRRGWSPTTLPAATGVGYAAEIAALERAITATRRHEPREPAAGGRGSRTVPMALCGCPRQIRGRTLGPGRRSDRLRGLRRDVRPRRRPLARTPAPAAGHLEPGAQGNGPRRRGADDVRRLVTERQHAAAAVGEPEVQRGLDQPLLFEAQESFEKLAGVDVATAEL